MDWKNRGCQTYLNLKVSLSKYDKGFAFAVNDGTQISSYIYIKAPLGCKLYLMLCISHVYLLYKSWGVCGCD